MSSNSGKTGKSVLVLAAHPDDETLGCGGTIAKLSDMGYNIQLLTFTDGVDARGVRGEKNRNIRLGKIAELLGIGEFAHANFPDNRMDTTPLLDICKFIEDSVPDQPDIIFTHHPDCLNVDHSMVYRSTITVFRPQFGNSVDLFAYYVPSATDYNPLNKFIGNTYFDVSEFVQKKINALKVYDEEIRKYPHSRSYENILNMMKVYGSEVGVEYAEKFQSIRRVIV